MLALTSIELHRFLGRKLASMYHCALITIDNTANGPACGDVNDYQTKSSWFYVYNNPSSRM